LIHPNLCGGGICFFAQAENDGTPYIRTVEIQISALPSTEGEETQFPQAFVTCISSMGGQERTSCASEIGPNPELSLSSFG
jgi:hypothetical protein